jgi:hypothetical protein
LISPRTAFSFLRGVYYREVFFRDADNRRSVINAAVRLLTAIEQRPTPMRVRQVLQRAFGYAVDA